jgi:hypothetical protein
MQAPLRLWVAAGRPDGPQLTSAIDRLLDRLPLERTGSLALRTDELQLACDLAAADGVLTETRGQLPGPPAAARATSRSSTS